MAALFVGAGANHLLNPAPYLAIMPPLLPAPAALVFISGIAEIAGGLGLLLRPVRKAAAVGLILLLIAVFPANIYAAMHGMQMGGRAIPAWLLWARLPLQLLLIAWVYFAGWKRRQAPR
ncbi:MAG: DoxX family protein [Verrucomicrobiota bacterium]|nr:DoxX family protein [Verrucomicrobiota bacterium]